MGWETVQFKQVIFLGQACKPWYEGPRGGKDATRGAPSFSLEQVPKNIHFILVTFLSRFLKQWVLVWNGYDGRIYISSSPTLGDRVFEPARVLVDKANDQEKNW